VNAAIERHQVMVRDNQTDGCLSCRNGTANNPQTRWGCSGTGAPPLQCAPRRSGTPPAASDDDESSETDGVPPA